MNQRTCSKKAGLPFATDQPLLFQLLLFYKYTVDEKAKPTVDKTAARERANDGWLLLLMNLARELVEFFLQPSRYAAFQISEQSQNVSHVSWKSPVEFLTYSNVHKNVHQAT